MIGSDDRGHRRDRHQASAPNGRPDRSFGKQGTLGRLGPPYDGGTTLDFRRHGAIWFSGGAFGPEDGRGGGEADRVLGRLNAKGKLDSSFSHTG